MGAEGRQAAERRTRGQVPSPPPLKRPADFCHRSGSQPVFGLELNIISLSPCTVSGCLCKLAYLSLLMLQLACRRDDKSVWERLPPSQPTWLGQHCFRTRKLDQQFELFVRIVDPRQRITRRVGQAWYVRDQPWPACRLTQIQRILLRSGSKPEIPL